jgi:hypothetical protein
MVLANQNMQTNGISTSENVIIEPTEQSTITRTEIKLSIRWSIFLPLD